MASATDGLAVRLAVLQHVRKPIGWVTWMAKSAVPNLPDRLRAAEEARRALLERAKAAALDPAAEERRQARQTIVAARNLRVGARKAGEQAQREREAAERAAAEAAAEAARAAALQAEAQAQTRRETERAQREAAEKAERETILAARRAGRKARKRRGK